MSPPNEMQIGTIRNIMDRSNDRGKAHLGGTVCAPQEEAATGPGH
jgi:hypothetical protein